MEDFKITNYTSSKYERKIKVTAYANSKLRSERNYTNTIPYIK